MNHLRKTFSIKKRALSFIYAYNGIVCFIKNEHNAWIHLFALICVVAAGFFYHISGIEWILITIVAGMVLISEGLNTAIEYFANFVSPEHHVLIGQVKDIASGAVLIAAIVAFITGLLIFIPYLCA